MKTLFKWLVVSSISVLSIISPAHAQIPVSDVASIQQQILQYTQQGLQYTRQGLQLQNELKNLMSNPTSLLGAEVGGVINGVGQIMSAGNAIGGNMARISSNFEKNFKNPQMRPMSEQFTQWHNTSTDTLGAAMKAAGLHRDSYQSDQDALAALYNRSQATQGNLQALQTMAQINAMQVQQMQKLGDLMATQNIATNTYIAAQTAKAEAQNQETDAVKRSLLAPRQPVSNGDTGSAPAKKWNLY